MIDVATRPHEVRVARRGSGGGARAREEVTLLDREAVRAEVNSPDLPRRASGTTLATRWSTPARLAWGLREAALGDGVRIHEHTPGHATATRRRRRGPRDAAAGQRAAPARVLLATNAYRPLIRSIRRYVVPVYDYVLVTEPLSDRAAARHRLAAAAGRRRLGQPLPLLPPDARAMPASSGAATRRIYHFRNGMRPELEDHAPTFELLARNFAATFPQLEGIRFTHRWAGAIDTC